MKVSDYYKLERMVQEMVPGGSCEFEGKRVFVTCGDYSDYQDMFDVPGKVLKYYMVMNYVGYQKELRFFWLYYSNGTIKENGYVFDVFDDSCVDFIISKIKQTMEILENAETLWKCRAIRESMDG